MTQPSLVQGDPIIDSRGFRHCLGAFGTGVTVMTTDGGGALAGVTANSFSSLSLDPPLVLWSIGRRSRSFDTFVSSKHFAVNILASEQIELSQNFASSSQDKFLGIDWSAGENGSPLLRGAAGALECTRESVQEGGDHVVIVGRVTRFLRTEKEPLLFVRGRYCTPQGHSDSPDAESVPASVEETYASLPLLSLLGLAHYNIIMAFEGERRRSGISVNENKVLGAVHDNPGISAEEVARKKYLGVQATEDLVADLIARGYLKHELDGGLHLTSSGGERRLDIISRIDSLEKDRLTGIPDAEINSARRFLQRLLERQP